MEPLIAVDVAILPPPLVTDAAVQLSAALPESESKGLRLDARHLPHITLTQQFVRAEDVVVITEAIGQLLTRRTALQLSIVGPGRGSSSVWMRVGPAPALLDLHRDLMHALEPFERTGGTSSSFVDGNARLEDVRWVSSFRATSSFNRYEPHITLGHATGLPPVTPLDFTADTVALCRLGRFCSCRDVLMSWRLAVL
jgi:hypothetical protein